MKNFFNVSITLLLIFFLQNCFADIPAKQTAIQTKPILLISPDQPEFDIKLSSNRTTGFSWFLVDYNDKLVTPLKRVYHPPMSQLVGAPGYEVWTFRMKSDAFIVPQQTLVRLVYQRPWEPLGQPGVSTFKITTVSQPISPAGK